MPDLRVWLESQATILRERAESERGYGSDMPTVCEALATLIDGMLEEHEDYTIGYCKRCTDSDYNPNDSPCPSLRLLATYVSAVTGNTPPEGAP